MNGLTKSKALTYLVAIFVAGVVTGVLGGYTLSRRNPLRPPPRPVDMATHIVDRWRKELNLTEDQVVRILPLMHQASAEIQGIQTNSTDRIIDVMDKTDRQIQGLLEPEQAGKFRRQCQERTARMRKVGHPPPPGSGPGFEPRPEEGPGPGHGLGPGPGPR